MPSRRDMIAMPDNELATYLAEQRRIILTTIGPNGMPHPMPMNFGVDGQGRVVVITFAKSQKVRNLQRDPRATLLVESGASYAELKSAILYCTTEVITQLDDVAAIMPHIRASDAMQASISGQMSDQVRAVLAKRVALRFTPQRVVSWDHGKLGGVY